ncbi:hypothetical protein FRB98_003387 [Tulasnella sp. 332]|nr:hypothetical protein FRB98_003387 [Tulasnella sp. 332]
MEDIPVDIAHFMGLIATTWMYGALVTAVSSALDPYLRVYLQSPRHRTYLVLVITICLLITSTANVVVSIGRGYAGFITYRENPGVIEYMEGWSVYEPLSNFFLAAAAITADSLLIFRLYTIWSQNRWIAVFPVILVCIESSAHCLPHLVAVLLFPGGVCAIMLCVLSAVPAKASYASNMAFDEATLILSSICTVLTNLICTPCIVGRLWWIGRRGQVKETRSFYTVVIVRLIESGSLYTTTLIVWIVFQVLPAYPNIGNLTNYIFIMIIAIAPMMIVIRINAGASGPVEMRNVVFDESAGVTDGQATPETNMGVVSTTIAFKAMQSGGTQNSRITE